MISFINDVIYGDLTELLDPELYQCIVAAVAATFAVLSFGGVVQIFTNLFSIILNFRSGRR